MLTAYGLAYSVTRPDIPGAIDYAEVALLTNNFLEAYFEAIFMDSTFTRLEQVFTMFVSGNFFFNQPIQIDYETEAQFDPSFTVPSVEDLDLMLKMAFEGENLNEYLRQLSTLTSNIFATTTTVVVTESSSAPLTEQQRKQGKNDIIQSRHGDSINARVAIYGSVGALCLGVLLGALEYFRRKRRRSQGESPTKNLAFPVLPPTGGDDGTVESRSEKLSEPPDIYLEELAHCLSDDEHSSSLSHITEEDDYPSAAKYQSETSPLFSSSIDTDVESSSFADVDF